MQGCYAVVKPGKLTKAIQLTLLRLSSGRLPACLSGTQRAFSQRFVRRRRLNVPGCT